MDTRTKAEYSRFAQVAGAIGDTLPPIEGAFAQAFLDCSAQTPYYTTFDALDLVYRLYSAGVGQFTLCCTEAQALFAQASELVTIYVGTSLQEMAAVEALQIAEYEFLRHRQLTQK